MRIAVLGGCGAWPAGGSACSGYLVEHDGYRLLVDPGYATVARLLAQVGAADIDAVLVSHGHPDHCADLNPLLRARVLSGEPPAPLPLYAPAGALDAVLALDRPAMLASGYRRHDLALTGEIGPFAVTTEALPHHLPNLGVRLAAGSTAIAYTGDCGPADGVVRLAEGTDLLIAEATYVDRVPDDEAGMLSSAVDAGEQAERAGAGRLLLTHLWPGTDPRAAMAAARTRYGGRIEVAVPGLVIDAHRS